MLPVDCKFFGVSDLRSKVVTDARIFFSVPDSPASLPCDDPMWWRPLSPPSSARPSTMQLLKQMPSDKRDSVLHSWRKYWIEEGERRAWERWKELYGELSLCTSTFDTFISENSLRLHFIQNFIFQRKLTQRHIE